MLLQQKVKSTKMFDPLCSRQLKYLKTFTVSMQRGSGVETTEILRSNPNSCCSSSLDWQWISGGGQLVPKVSHLLSQFLRSLHWTSSSLLQWLQLPVAGWRTSSNLISSEGNPFCVLQDCSLMWTKMRSADDQETGFKTYDAKDLVWRK